MAKRNPLHDHPRSKEIGEQLAEAGDTKTIKGVEYESTGDENPSGLSQDRPTPSDPKEWPHETKDKDGKIEYWRRKKKPVPVS